MDAPVNSRPGARLRGWKGDSRELLWSRFSRLPGRLGVPAAGSIRTHARDLHVGASYWKSIRVRLTLPIAESKQARPGVTTRIGDGGPTAVAVAAARQTADRHIIRAAPTRMRWPVLVREGPQVRRRELLRHRTIFRHQEARSRPKSRRDQLVCELSWHVPSVGGADSLLLILFAHLAARARFCAISRRRVSDQRPSPELRSARSDVWT